MSQLHMSSKTSIVLLLLVQDLLWLVVGLLWVGVWGFFLVGCWVCFGFGGGGGVSIISSQEDSRFILIFFSILKK